MPGDNELRSVEIIVEEVLISGFAAEVLEYVVDGRAIHPVAFRGQRG
jgi:hypothetical protein